MAIEVTLEDHTGNMRRTVKMADNAAVRRLIPPLLTALELPATDPSGRPITYTLSHEGRALQPDESLSAAGVQNSDLLTIVPEMSAGAVCGPADPEENAVLIESMRPSWEYAPVDGVPQHLRHLLRPDDVAINIPPLVFRKAWIHAASAADIEVGGLLMGQVYKEVGGYVVDVQDVIDAQETVASSTSLTFTTASWMGINRQRLLKPDEAVVGWYHTHPGHGVYLSNTDVFLHRSFFGAQPWYLALVIDPQRLEWGAFRCDQNHILRIQTGTIPSKAAH